MELIEGVSLSKLCDYSFGDQSGQWGNVFTSFMKDANLLNLEFVSKVFEIKRKRSYMTLFIDNIRLYKRDIAEVKESDRLYVNSLIEKSDLLNLCSKFPEMRFIIFTNLEDTPIDEYIFDSIPDNVLCISAVNAIANGGKVIPAPYGLQRSMTPSDRRNSITLDFINSPEVDPSFLLYVNHSDDTNKERIGIKDIFRNKSWAMIQDYRISYSEHLEKIKQSKFVICPRGNAIDCHRNWEVVYVKRVPVMKRHPYLEKLFENYPVLFVEDYSQVTEKLLIDNNHLFEEAKTIDINQLTLPTFFDKIVNKAIKEKYASK
jgi:hypothetical protein